jgi:hypothetical protein
MRLPILVLHICAGILGLLSGAAAVSFRKGSRWHRVAGNIFFVSLLGMSTAGAYLAFMKHQMNNVFGGVLAFYLVTTAWATGRRRDGETSIFDWGALLVALAVGAIILTYGFEVANSPTGPKDGIPAGMYFFLVPWLCFLPLETFACSCAAGFSVYIALRDTFGACAFRCSSPQGPFSWDSNKYSPTGYAKQTYFFSRPSCH